MKVIKQGNARQKDNADFVKKIKAIFKKPEIFMKKIRQNKFENETNPETSENVRQVILYFFLQSNEIRSLVLLSLSLIYCYYKTM